MKDYIIHKDDETGTFTVALGNDILYEHLDYDELIEVVKQDMLCE